MITWHNAMFVKTIFYGGLWISPPRRGTIPADKRLPPAPCTGTCRPANRRAPSRQNLDPEHLAIFPPTLCPVGVWFFVNLSKRVAANSRTQRSEYCRPHWSSCESRFLVLLPRSPGA